MRRSPDGAARSRAQEAASFATNATRSPIARTVRGSAQLPLHIPSNDFLGSYTPEGGRVSPVFDVQLGATISLLVKEGLTDCQRCRIGLESQPIAGVFMLRKNHLESAIWADPELLCVECCSRASPAAAETSGVESIET
mgnify:CR=1 FL=1